MEAPINQDKFPVYQGFSLHCVYYDDLRKILTALLVESN